MFQILWPWPMPRGPTCTKSVFLRLGDVLSQLGDHSGDTPHRIKSPRANSKWPGGTGTCTSSNLRPELEVSMTFKGTQLTASPKQSPGTFAQDITGWMDWRAHSTISKTKWLHQRKTCSTAHVWDKSNSDGLGPTNSSDAWPWQCDRSRWVWYKGTAERKQTSVQGLKPPRHTLLWLSSKTQNSPEWAWDCSVFIACPKTCWKVAKGPARHFLKSILNLWFLHLSSQSPKKCKQNSGRSWHGMPNLTIQFFQLAENNIVFSLSPCTES